MKRIFYITLILLLGVRCFADTSATYTNVNGSGTVSFYEAGEGSTDTWRVDTATSIYGGTISIFVGTQTNNGGSAGSYFTVTRDQSVTLRMYSSADSWLTAGEWSLTFTPTAQVFYKVSFALPANNTDHRIAYQVYQNGSPVGGAYYQSPGAAAYILTVTGLTSNAVCTLVEVTENLRQGQDENGNTVWIWEFVFPYIVIIKV